MASHRAILIQCQSVNGGPRPPDDVAEADQSVEQRAKDERLPTMHRISIARRSKMLIDCLLAYSKDRSEEHTSELQSLMRISYAVFCLKKKKQHAKITKIKTQ